MNLALSVLLIVSVVSIKNAEMVTVTDTGFTVSWTTSEPAKAEILYGEDPGRLNGSVVSDTEPATNHLISVSGLRPGTRYYYRIKSGKKERPPRPMPPARIKTLEPPDGERLFSFAVMNDIHAMEDIAGVIVLPSKWMPPISPGFTWRHPVDNYWEFTLRDAVEEVNKTDASFTVINGDLTSWYTRPEFEAVKSHLERLEMPYYVTRGNHDRIGDNPEDYFLATFGLESSWYSVDHKGFHFIMLDDNRVEDGWHGFPEEEWAWLEQDLSGHSEMPTFVFSHRPMGAGWVDVDKDIRLRFLDILSKNPQVAAVLNAHSHRAKVVTVPESTGDTPFIEVPATKEYPVGFALLEVYEGGFLYSFRMLDCRDCLEWNRITRKEYFGLAPRVLMQDIEDRCFTYRFPDEIRALMKKDAPRLDAGSPPCLHRGPRPP